MSQELDAVGLDDQLAATLATAGFGGRAVRPSDPGYDRARAVWNAMIDRRPALIAYCTGVSDVIAAVNVARDAGVPVAVRAGGHNVSGSAVCDRGLVIDLSEMHAVQVDERSGRVRAEGGTTIGQLDQATQAIGLAVPQGVVSETGIAGLTLGGGLGWLRRKHGLSCDNLRSAELVTAEGRLVVAAPDENPDLLWGLQGGGGNFGIVTSFELQAHPVGPDVHAAVLFHPADEAGSVLRFYREWEASCPDEISSLAILGHGPDIEDFPAEHRGEPVAILAAVYAGNPQEGAEVLRPLREHGRPVADFGGTMPYVELQQFFDEDYPAGELRYYWKSLYLDDLDDEALGALIELNEHAPSPLSTLDLWELGGAVGRVDAAATAFGDRSAPFLLGIEANWVEPTDDDANLAWARRAHQEMARFSRGGEYLNFGGFYEGGDATMHATFGDNYGRLASLKRQWDPSNLFHLNQNIAPA